MKLQEQPVYSMRDRIGMTAAGVYRHCRDKADLFGQLVSPAVQDMNAWLMGHIQRNAEALQRGSAQLWQDTEINMMRDLVYPRMDEYRLLDGWSRDRKRGSHRYERIPLQLRDQMLLTCPEDYMQLVPEDLPEPFTSAQFAEAVGFRKKGISTVLLLLTELGVLERVGKKGNAYLYRILE